MIKLPDTEVGPFHKWEKQGKLEQWGSNEFGIAKEFIKNYRTCLDIGAHVGITSLRYSDYFHKVHSFEPILYEYAQENLVERHNVTVYPYAVSDFEGEVTMWINPRNTGRSIVETEMHQKRIQRDHLAEDGVYKDIAPKNVKTVRIDDFNFTDVDFVKIDVEGYSLPVIKGMLDTIDRCKPCLQVEGADEATDREVRSILKTMGYVLRRTMQTKPKEYFYSV